MKGKVAQSCQTLSGPMDSKPARLLCPRNSPGQDTEMGNWSLLCRIFPEIKPRCPALQKYSIPSEPPGLPKNTEVDMLLLLWGDLPEPGIELKSSELQVDSLPAELGGVYQYTKVYLKVLPL